MGYAVELFFDRETERRVTQLWDQFSAAGVSSVLPSIGSRPHISVAVLDDAVPRALEGALRDLAQTWDPVELSLVAVGTFPTAEGVVFLSPSVSGKLIQLHRHVHDRIQELGFQVNPYYRPGRWVPHCTIATDLSQPMLNRAIQIALESGVFGPAQLRSIGLIAYRPVQEVFEIRLGHGV